MVFPLQKKISITVVGYISGNFGLAIVVRNIINLLLKKGYDLALYDVLLERDEKRRVTTYDHLLCNNWEKKPENPITIFLTYPLEYQNLINSKLPIFDRSKSLHILVPFWELQELPSDWIPILESVDGILCPSKYIFETVQRSIPNVFSAYFPQTVYIPDNLVTAQEKSISEKDTFTFITSFDLASDVERKNPWAVCQAFSRAFENDENVKLIIKVTGKEYPVFKDEYELLCAYTQKDKRIEIIDSILTYEETLSLYATTDCLVSLHRAEGLGLCCMEAMSLGKVAIATGWSGNMDFMDPTNSALVPYTLTKVSRSRIFTKQRFRSQNVQWAEPQISSAVDWMKRLYNDRTQYKKLSLKARSDMKIRQKECEGAQLIDGLLEAILSFKNKIRCKGSDSGRESKLPIRKVLFLNRTNAFSEPGGDTIVMNQYKVELEKRGVCVDIQSSPEAISREYDLVHLFNVTLPSYTERFARQAVAYSVPFVITALQENFPIYLNRARILFSLLESYVGSGQNPILLKNYKEVLDKQSQAPCITSPYAINTAELILTSGNAEAHFLKSYFSGVNTQNVHFGCNISDENISKELFIKEFGIDNFILCVGRLETRKNQLALLKALEEDDVTIVFADGGFTYQKRYDEVCRNFKRRGKTIFTGRLSKDMLISAYKAAKLHCLPSLYELPGLVTLEAARYGCPVTASSWGTIKDYMGDSCSYFEPDDFDDIRRVVLDAYSRGDLKYQQDKASQFTWGNSVSSLLVAYSKAIESFQKRGGHRKVDPTIFPPIDSFDFVEQTVQFIESGQIHKAMSLYTQNRNRFGNDDELLQFDKLIQQIKSKVLVRG